MNRAACAPTATPTIGPAPWALSLKAAAATLASVPATVVCRISLSGQLCGIGGEHILLRAVAERLAHEHDLRAEIEIRDGRFSIRLSHPTAEGQ